MPRAAIYHGPGRPLELVAFPTPELRGGEVLVRVTFCTLCRSDLHTHAGRRAEPVPTVLGHEVVGRVAAFGPDAPRADALGKPAATGDRVTWAVAVGCGTCALCANELPQKCERRYKYGHERLTPGRPPNGGLAEFIVLVPGTAWFRVPDELPDGVAAPANCATATVVALVRHAGPLAGRRVIVLGAGVLGLTACAMARAAGATTVVAADPLAANRERAAAFGATHACGPGELPAADVVLELSGTADGVRAGLAAAAVGGTVILAGTVSPVGTIPLDPEAVVRRMLTVRGVHNYHPRDLATALEFLAGPGRAFPFASLVAADFPLDRVEEAFAFAHGRPGVRVAVRH